MGKGIDYYAPKTDAAGNTLRNYHRTTGANTTAGTATEYTRATRPDPRKPAYDPAAAAAATAESAARAREAAEGAPQQPAFGSQSGPGIMESWFNQRATGTDPAFNYLAGRGMEGIGNQYAASGAFNSGAARQQESDFMANLVAQRMGQLDALAGGASGEHQARLNAMFAQGLGIAGGQSGLSSAYDLGAAGNMDAANRAMMQLGLNKAGVDAQGNQGAINNIMAFWGMGQGGKKAE